MADSILHVTLNTGHARRSPRKEVSQMNVDAVALELARALRDGEADIRLGGLADQPPHYRLKASTAGGALVCTVLSPGEAPLVTFGVARKSLPAARLWELLTSQGDVATTAHRPERTPWLAVRIEPSITGDPSALTWLADYERLVAWAWMERDRGNG
jgi:hypothetical protein